jgi:AcrR family transcriptional regulator
MIQPLALPPGPRPNPHRDPLALALVAEVNARGPEAGDPDEIARRAGIPRSEFDRRYSGFDECLVDTYERFIASFERAVGSAFNAHGDWRTALRAAAYASADWMAASPELMEFGAVGVLRTTNEVARVRREEVARFCAGMVEQGRRAAADPEQIPEGASLLAIGAILNLLTQRIQEGDQIDLLAEVPELMYLVVRVYRGEREAREELSLPRPSPAWRPR